MSLIELLSGRKRENAGVVSSANQYQLKVRESSAVLVLIRGSYVAGLRLIYSIITIQVGPHTKKSVLQRVVQCVLSACMYVHRSV